MVVEVEAMNPYSNYDQMRSGDYYQPVLPEGQAYIRIEDYDPGSDTSQFTWNNYESLNLSPMKKTASESYIPLPTLTKNEHSKPIADISKDTRDMINNNDQDNRHDKGDTAHKEIIKDAKKKDKNEPENKQNIKGSSPYIEVHYKDGHLRTGTDENENNPNGDKKQFAFTPKDKEYFEITGKRITEAIPRVPKGELIIHHEGGSQTSMVAMAMPQRQIRQNPNFNKQKHLLEPDVDKLKSGFGHPSYTKYTFSMTNAEEEEEGVHVADADPTESVYGIALIAAVGAAVLLASVGLGFGWYTLSKRVKAAADVDYPAYGVTGPSVDTSGDRKLAHSAHMYHYQHQKQQIIAMERHGLEQGTGSISDVDSEEENEEGDYTVYECPGFATTGDMEVRNPMFTEDPTPATPGKCQVVKPQPKN